jgi:hypothetical protein
MMRRGPPVPRTDPKNEQIVLFFSPVGYGSWMAFSVVVGGQVMNAQIKGWRGELPGGIGKERAEQALIRSITKVCQIDLSRWACGCNHEKDTHCLAANFPDIR